MNVDADADVDVDIDDLSNTMLGKRDEESRPTLWRSAGMSMAGWKRWGQK